MDYRFFLEQLADSAVYDKPHATCYKISEDDSFDVVGNTDGSSITMNMKQGPIK